LLEEDREVPIEAVWIAYWCGELVGSLGVAGEEKGESDRAICGGQGRSWEATIATYLTTTAAAGYYNKKSPSTAIVTCR
jgi:hypothetical protein